MKGNTEPFDSVANADATANIAGKLSQNILSPLVLVSAEIQQTPAEPASFKSNKSSSLQTPQVGSSPNLIS